MKQWLIFFLLSLVFFSSLWGQTLKPYTCVSDRLNVSAYDNPENTIYSRDADGVIMDNNRYHPVRIAMYGILCHAEFVANNDSSYYYKMRNQVIFFKDSTKWDVAFEGRGIGFPYTIDWHDLKPPWYSGMAQGAALSFLLRYAELTGDLSVYPYCKRIAYFLIQPEEKGGTISVPVQGQMWIEEYPNSEGAPQVLNGSINGLIGLMEYCGVFPEDTAARRVKNTCLTTMSASIHLFNMPGWCRYDLGKRTCTPNYLRYHVYQMKHLYELTGEDVYYKQMMIWSAICSSRVAEDTLGLVRQPDHLISVHASPGPKPWLLPKHGMAPVLDDPAIDGAIHVFQTREGLMNYLDNGVLPKTISDVSTKQYLFFEFNKPIYSDYFTFQFGESMAGVSLSLAAISAKTSKFEELEVNIDQLSNDFCHGIILSGLKDEGFKGLLLEITGPPLPKIAQSKIGLYNTNTIDAPWFGHYSTSVVPVEKGKPYWVEVPVREVKECVVFYREAVNKHEVEEKAWEPQLEVKDGLFTSQHGGYCQFLVMYKVENPLSLVGMLRYAEKKSTR